MGIILSKKVLGILVYVSVISVVVITGVAGATGVTGTSFSFHPQTSDKVAIGPSVVLTLLLSFTAAQNCQVDAIASSLLASLVL